MSNMLYAETSDPITAQAKVVGMGQRVGRNPPSVLGDIHLVGIPAPQAAFTGAYYPFHGVCRLFTLTASLLNASASSSLAGGGIFSAPLTQPLGRHLAVPRFRHVDGVSSGPSRIGPGVAHQLANPNNSSAIAVNKYFAPTSPTRKST